jgi:hypothetical protein
MSDNLVLYANPDALDAAEEPLSAAEADALDRVNRRIAASPSLDGLMDFLFDETLPDSPCDRLGLALIEEDGKRITTRWARAAYEPLLLKDGYTEDFIDSSLSAVVRSGQYRIINDLELYLKQKPDSRSTRILVKEGVRSSLTCPLTVDGRIAGVLFRSARKPNAYSVRDLVKQRRIAERLSQAVEKASMILQLKRANDSYIEMLGFVSHEMKSPVASMVTNARLILDGYIGDISDKQRDTILSIERKGEFLLDLVRQYLDLAKIETGELRPALEPIDFIDAVAKPAMDIIEPQRTAAKMTLDVVSPGSLPPVDCDPSLMRIVMVNLLGNAVKYGNEGGAVRLTLERRDGWLRVSVMNEGPGFPADQRDKLFKKFSRLNAPELKKRKGTGVGLYTTWRIIEAHGGKIRAESEPGRSATFYFDLPVRAE